MPSNKKCPYCGADLRSDEEVCPGCGAPNEYFVSGGVPSLSHRPRTMEDLKDFAAEHSLPLEQMRFYVGRDYRESRAYGIYQDGDKFIVYKNKADGSRAIRYAGPDEERAVGELYEKLLSECHNRGFYPEQSTPISSRIRQPSRPAASRHSGGRPGQGLPGSLRNPKISLALIALLLILFFARSCGLGLGSAPEEESLYSTGNVLYEGEGFDEWEYDQADQWDDDRVDSWDSSEGEDWEYEWNWDSNDSYWDSDDTDWESDW